MKKLVTIILVLNVMRLYAHPAPATGLKTAKIAYVQTNGTLSIPRLITNDQVLIDTTDKTINKFKVIYALAANHTLFALKVKGVPKNDTLSFDLNTINVVNTPIKLVEKDANGKGVDSLTFTFKADQTTDTAKNVVLTSDQLQQFYNIHYKKLVKYDVGYKDGSDFYTIHVFLDQYGNNLFGSMPTGVQRKYHYQLHVLYPVAQETKYRYMVDVTSGSLTDAVTNYNSNATLPDMSKKAPDSTSLQHGEIADTGVSEYLFNLFPTSGDLSFTINFLPVSGKVPPVPILLKTYTIKKTPFYFGSFDVGILYTWINNPTYAMTASPVTSGAQAVKVTNNKPYVSAALMYTVYFSIVNAFDHTKYNTWGRSYLDDEGGFFRKIYPAIGVGLSGEVFTNWFVGLNFQPMQGFGIFAGRNIRKVNTFNAPGTVDQNNITADQFNFYQNTKTRSDWSIGILLDTNVFTKLIGNISTAATSK